MIGKNILPLFKLQFLINQVVNLHIVIPWNLITSDVFWINGKIFSKHAFCYTFICKSLKYNNRCYLNISSIILSNH